MCKTIRGLGPANLLRVFDTARSILPVLTSFLLASSLASAQNGSLAPRPSEQFSFMQLLAAKDPHDIANERWNPYGQFTYISNRKPSFYAPYTNLNGSTHSLLAAADRSFTGTATLDLDVRLWRGAEGYLVPELITERPFSQLQGWEGAIHNFDLQKGGTTTPQVYLPTAQESTQPATPDDTALGLMDHLSKTGQHDVHDETWNLYGQLTTIGFYKPSFHAAYTDLNGSNSSLRPIAETSFTQTLTFFFGLRLRPGTELYIVPEEIVRNDALEPERAGRRDGELRTSEGRSSHPGTLPRAALRPSDLRLRRPDHRTPVEPDAARRKRGQPAAGLNPGQL